MYATEHVDKNELLMVIPSKVVFSASYDDNVDGKKSEKKKNSTTTTTTTTTNVNDKLCATVTKLANKYTKGHQPVIIIPFYNTSSIRVTVVNFPNHGVTRVKHYYVK